MKQPLHIPTRPVRVSLVGAGPGDAELLTVRALRRLQEADVVLHDRLVSDEILALCDHARLINVGKKPGGKRTSQEVINHLLLKEARAGGNIVRLKGGDPFVFGRGGEEAIFLREHGIAEIEIVPGISSSISAPALAGIPVTHRGVSTHFSVVTGMGATPDGTTLSEQWANLVSSGGTTVFLMSVRKLPAILETLREANIDGSLPCAFVESASTPEERVTVGTLASIEEIANEVGVRSPAAFVVGEVVRLHARISNRASDGETAWSSLVRQIAY